MAIGFVVLIQLLENYIGGRVFEEETGLFDRTLMHTGWGMHNNIGVMMAITMPFAFYLSLRHRQGWIFGVLGGMLLAGTLASCSRTSMAVAVVAFVFCMGVLLWRAEGRKVFLVMLGLVAVAVTVVVNRMWEHLAETYQLFFDDLMSLSGRDELFVNGVKQLLQYPYFGGSFYPQTEFVPYDWAELESFSSFFPPRWHNTLIQIGASCGFVGLAAYAFHRCQTIWMLATKRSLEKLFIAISLAALLAASLLDCHFFNVGPAMFYSMALAFAEKIGQSELD
jgi:O-antigen ligase